MIACEACLASFPALVRSFQKLIHSGAGTCWLSFSVRVLMFPVLGVTVTFYGVLGILRLWALYNFMFLAGCSSGAADWKGRSGVCVQLPSGPDNTTLARAGHWFTLPYRRKKGSYSAPPSPPTDSLWVKVGSAAARSGREWERRGANEPCLQSPKSILLLVDWVEAQLPTGPILPAESVVLATPACITSSSLIAAGWRWRFRSPLGPTDTTWAGELHSLVPLGQAWVSCPCGPVNTIGRGTRNTACSHHTQNRLASHSALLTLPCGVRGACRQPPPR